MVKLKRITALILTLLLLVGVGTAVASSAGGSGDPLISVSYIKETYINQMNQEVLKKINTTLGSLFPGNSTTPGSTGSFYTKNILTGGTITLDSGSSVILLSGSGTMNFNGTVVSITDGTTPESGSSLIRYNRYLAAENTTVTVNILSSAYVAIEGSASVTGSVETPFGDVIVSEWYYDAVNYAVENGLFNGTSDTTFSPSANMTRAMLVTVLHRMEGKPSVGVQNTFTDVKSGQWYTDAILWANSNGIVTGYGNGIFGINDPITREQMSAILYRYASSKGYDVTNSDELIKYTDAGKIGSWALDAMKWAVAEGHVNGTSDTTLTPAGSATRAQVATMLMRFMEKTVR